MNDNKKETEIEAHLRKRIEVLKGECIKLDPKHYAGIPDRLCLLGPGNAFFVETKAKNGKVSKIQKFWHKILRKLGFRVWVPFSVEDCDTIISFETAETYSRAPSKNEYGEHNKVPAECPDCQASEFEFKTFNDFTGRTSHGESRCKGCGLLFSVFDCAQGKFISKI